MSRRTRLFLLIGLGLVVVAVVVLLGLYVALRHEPTFYRKALDIEPAVLEKASDRMLQKLATIESVLAKPGRWKIVITDEEINGWLAVDMMKNHPNTLPPTMHAPRVAIRPNEVIVGCRYEQGCINSVLSLTLQPCLPERNVVALRIVRARAGGIPVALKRVLDGVSKAAHDMQIRLDWKQAGSDPVAMLSLPDDPDADRVVRINSLQVIEDEIHISGATEQRKKK
jgi:hypothetical protein